MLVWLASYPKSGNTWLRALLTAVRHPWAAGLDINALDGHASLLDADEFEDITGLNWCELDDDEREACLADVIAALAAASPQLSLRKTHEMYRFDPAGRPLFDRSSGARAIYLVRDPRDVAVSFAAHLGQSLHDAIATMANSSATIGRMAGVRQELLGSWSENVMSWQNQVHIPLLTIRYEDMLAAPSVELRRALDFMEIEASCEALDRAVQLASFETLSRQERTTRFVERQQEASAFFRKGQAGEWRETLSQAQVKHIEERHAHAMDRLGYQPTAGSRFVSE